MKNKYVKLTRIRTKQKQTKKYIVTCDIGHWKPQKNFKYLFIFKKNKVNERVIVSVTTYSI